MSGTSILEDLFPQASGWYSNDRCTRVQERLSCGPHFMRDRPKDGMLSGNAIDSFHAVHVVRPTPSGFVGAPSQLLGPTRRTATVAISDFAATLLPPKIGALLTQQQGARLVDGTGGGGGGRPPKRPNTGDGSPGGGWRRSQLVKYVLLCLTLALAVLAVSFARGSQSTVTGPLAWSEELLMHLAGLAAEWDVPIASTYLRTIVRAASSRRELCQAVDTILLAEDDLDAAGAGGGDEALLLASAVTCVALSDLLSRDLIPKIIKYKDEQLYWAGRAEPHWRLALESFSLPLGPALAARFPRRSLAHRVHDCKVLERAAQAQAADAAETLGRIHHALTNLAAVHDAHQLRVALRHNLLQIGRHHFLSFVHVLDQIR